MTETSLSCSTVLLKFSLLVLIVDEIGQLITKYTYGPELDILVLISLVSIEGSDDTDYPPSLTRTITSSTHNVCIKSMLRLKY